MARLGMVIDTRLCVGCQDCVVACKTENRTPEGMHRDWITQQLSGSFPTLELQIRSERCNHCDDPPCVTCCPTGASHVHDWGGVVLVTREKCIGCNRCVQWCPVQAILLKDRKAVIDYETCYGCGECVASCPYGAIATQWKTTPEAIQEKIVEHVAGAVAGKDGKVVYLSFVTAVSPDCDCWSFSDAPVVADIGVLASTDIVAIDQAAYDLIVSANGLPGGLGEGMGAGTDKFTKITGIDGTHAMRYAEKHGLGSRTYDLRTME